MNLLPCSSVLPHGMNTISRGGLPERSGMFTLDALSMVAMASSAVGPCPRAERTPDPLPCCRLWGNASAGGNRPMKTMQGRPLLFFFLFFFIRQFVCLTDEMAVEAVEAVSEFRTARRLGKKSRTASGLELSVPLFLFRLCRIFCSR